MAAVQVFQTSVNSRSGQCMAGAGNAIEGVPDHCQWTGTFVDMSAVETRLICDEMTGTILTLRGR